MRKTNVELTLYCAHCHDDGCSEGPFYPDAADENSKKRYQKAMDTIHKYLRPGWEFGLFIDGLGSLVTTEEEAQKLIDYAEQNIPGRERVSNWSNPSMEDCFSEGKSILGITQTRGRCWKQ